MAPHSSTLAWKIPWMEEPGWLQSIGSLRVGHDWATSLSFFTFMHWRRKWQPTPVFLPRESMGSHRVGHDWSDLAAAAAATTLDSILSWASLVAQTVINLPAMRETWVWSLGWEDLLDKGMETHSRILAWKIQWTEEPCELHTLGSQRVIHNWATNTFFFFHILKIGKKYKTRQVQMILKIKTDKELEAFQAFPVNKWTKSKQKLSLERNTCRHLSWGITDCYLGNDCYKHRRLSWS